MKNYRRDMILKILSEEEIHTQGELLEALERHGFPSTQATLSRDIRALHLVKEKGIYTRPAKIFSNDSQRRLDTILKESIISISQAQNLLVIHTLPGLANGACSALDGMHIPGLVGTLAGDDTAFVAMTDKDVASDFIQQLTELVSQ